MSSQTPRRSSSASRAMSGRSTGSSGCIFGTWSGGPASNSRCVWPSGAWPGPRASCTLVWNAEQEEEGSGGGYSLHCRFNIFRGTANIFRRFLISSCLSIHFGKALNSSGVSQSARLKHGMITAHCNLATGRSWRTAILRPSS